MNDRKNLIPLFSTFLLWGSLYIVSKVALRTIPPVTLLAMRYLVSIPALFLLLKLRGVMKPLQREDFKTVLAIGVVGYFASFCLQMLGIDRLSGSVSSLLGAMNPIFIPILAAVFLKEKITAAKVLCVAVSMAGVVLIVGVDGTVDPAGAALMLGSVFLWSSASIIIRRVSGKYDPMQVAMMAMICALPFTGLWAAVELQSSPCTLTAPGLAAVLYMGHGGGAHALESQPLTDGRELLLDVLPLAAAGFLGAGRSFAGRGDHAGLCRRRPDHLLRHCRRGAVGKKEGVSRPFPLIPFCRVERFMRAVCGCGCARFLCFRIRKRPNIPYRKDIRSLEQCIAGRDGAWN